MGDGRTDRIGLDAVRGIDPLPGWSPRAPGGARLGSAPAAVVAYSPELGALVCQYVAVGFSLSAIEDMPAMPLRRSVYRWLVDHPEFATEYQRARQALADVYAHEIIEISDASTEPAIGDDGVVTAAPDARSRDVRIRTRQWLMGKLNREKYGEASRVEVRRVSQLGDLTDDELQALKADMMRRLKSRPPVIDQPAASVGIASHAAADEI